MKYRVGQMIKIKPYEQIRKLGIDNDTYIELDNEYNYWLEDMENKLSSSRMVKIVNVRAKRVICQWPNGNNWGVHIDIIDNLSKHLLAIREELK